MKFIIITFFSCLTALSFAQENYKRVEDATYILEKMKSISSETKTIQCEFVQEKELSFMDKKMVSSGQLYFSGDNALRWEYSEPYNYAILIVQNKLIVIDEGEANQTKIGNNPAFKKIQEMMTQTITGDFISDESMFNQRILENDQYFLIQLTPKNKEVSEFVSKMDVYFSKPDFMLQKFVMDEQGDLTTTTFSNQKINEPLPNGVFEWN